MPRLETGMVALGGLCGEREEDRVAGLGGEMCITWHHPHKELNQTKMRDAEETVYTCNRLRKGSYRQ